MIAFSLYIYTILYMIVYVYVCIIVKGTKEERMNRIKIGSLLLGLPLVSFSLSSSAKVSLPCTALVSFTSAATFLKAFLPFCIASSVLSPRSLSHFSLNIYIYYHILYKKMYI